MRFYYEIVTSNGHGVHGSRPTLRAAQAFAASLGERSLTPGPYELQQVREHNYGRRYWMREGHRWVAWDPHRDIDARRPDWRWPSAPIAPIQRPETTP